MPALSPTSALLFAACLAATATASPPAAESVDRVEPYTLQLGPDGRPLDGYFYLGFVHGLPHQMVHLGFNGRQSTSRGSQPFYGNPLPEPPVRTDPHGLRYYSLAWGANSLGDAIGWARQKAERGGRLTPGEAALVALPRTFDAKGEARTRRRSSLNLFDPATLELLHRYAREHVRVWSADVPNRATGGLIDRWGLDNEWEGEGGPDYSPEARAAFVGWLEKAYQNDVAGLNRSWRTSHRTFAAAANGPLPSANDYATQSGAFLDWWTFQSEHFVTTLAGLARVLHAADPARRGVVHKSTQQTIEMPGVNRTHLFDHDLFAELMRPISGGLYGADIYGAGDRQAYELNYLYNCIRPLDGSPGHGVFLPETNNHGGPGHAFAATAWGMLANGLKAADLFTLGFAGAQNDWDKFGFIDSATGAPKDKLFYAGRWAHAIRRAEAFWTRATPVEGVPRVALLMPRRDVLLSPLSTRTSSRWSYPRNHRWMVFRWLREQGHWVDVIPYSKLTAGNLARYDALFLVGAAHLDDTEKQTIEAYATSGGILVTDTNVAAYDARHRPRASGLLPFVPVEGGSGELALELGGHSVVAEGAYRPGRLGAARVVATSIDGKPAALLAEAGKGRVLHFPFELGSLVPRRPGEAMPAFLAEGPTADSEEYIIPAGELVFGRWIGDLLRQAGLKPAFSADAGLSESGNLRVEQPYSDSAGNLVLVVTTRADSAARSLPAGTITAPLPGGPWRRALFAPAEHDGLTEVRVRHLDGDRHEIELPAVRTAAVLHFFPKHEPLLGIPAIDSPARSIDGHTAKVAPGKPFTIEVQLHNTTGASLPAGRLRGLVPEGWTLSPATLATPALPPEGTHAAGFTITPRADSSLLNPDWIHPIVIRWNDGARDRAVISANVQTMLDQERFPLLLSGNASYPPTYPHRLETGATYRITVPEQGKVADPADPKATTPALTNGFDNRTGARSSTSGARFAVVHGTRAAVEFDLKSQRELMTVVITRGPRGPAPALIRLVVVSPGGERAVLAEERPHPESPEIAFRGLRTRARNVVVEFDWPEEGGSLDEIEIWGR